MKDKILIFDLGDVIINLKPELKWWEEDLLPNFERNKLLQIFEQKFFHNFEKGIVSVEEFLNTMNEIKINSDTTIEDAWCAILQDLPQHRLNLLEKLSQQNTIYLLSNTNNIHLNYILNNKLNKTNHHIFNNLFKTKFYSQQIGMRKPDKEIYEYVHAQVENSSKEIYFFDDKLENLKIPKQLGWQTYLVNQDIANIIQNIANN